PPLVLSRRVAKKIDPNQGRPQRAAPTVDSIGLERSRTPRFPEQCRQFAIWTLTFDRVTTQCEHPQRKALRTTAAPRATVARVRCRARSHVAQLFRLLRVLHGTACPCVRGNRRAQSRSYIRRMML